MIRPAADGMSSGTRDASESHKPAWLHPRSGPHARRRRCRCRGECRAGRRTAAALGPQHDHLVRGTAITFWFPAVGLSDSQKAPTVLGPGFGGQAQSNPDAPSGPSIPAWVILRRAGYNVLTWNPRGISPSGGQAQLNNPDFEGRDVSGPDHLGRGPS